MRFISTSNLKEDMILGKTLYDHNGRILLSKGAPLKIAYINRIKELAYNGVYIQDQLSENIEVKNLVSEEIKQKAVLGIKNIFICSDELSSEEKDKLQEIKLLVEEIINEILSNDNLMINIVDLKIFDEYTYYHSVNVAVFSIVIGAALKLNRVELYELGLGALLHDIGKIFIEKDVLLKPGKLNNEEFNEIKTHSRKGYEFVREKLDIPLKSHLAILEHHEKFDGTGYPDGKSGKEISLFGRIISIADVYDALISDRPYRKGLLPSEGMEYIMGGCGSIFDYNLVKLFSEKVAPYPLGTCVKLSSGDIGIVIKNYEDCCMRPRIKMINKNDGVDEPYYVDLKIDSKYINVTIIEVVEI